MKFDPVHLENGFNGRISQTALRHFAACPRSAYLYQKYRDQPLMTREMVRGSALHAVAERMVKMAVEMGEPTVPPEVVKVLLDEVLGEYPVPLEEHDYLRESVYRYASETAIDPNAVVSCETLFVLRAGAYDVRCRIDFAELLDDGQAVLVEDLKSSRHAPAFDELSRKRPDGTLAAKATQLVMYALVLAFGVPVREDECPHCESGAVFGGSDTNEAYRCEHCDGKGRREIPEPFPVAQRAQTFNLSFVYPGIEDRDGKMLRRPVTLTRLELEEYRGSLESILHRLARSEETGDWPAVVSDEACGICPARPECPIPGSLRNDWDVGTLEEATVAAEWLDLVRRNTADVQKQIKAVAKREGVPIRFGLDKVQDFGFEQKRTVDWDGLEAANERFHVSGEMFNFDDFVKVSKSTPFKVRTLTADELEQEAAGGDIGAAVSGRDDG